MKDLFAGWYIFFASNISQRAFLLNIVSNFLTTIKPHGSSLLMNHADNCELFSKHRKRIGNLSSTWSDKIHLSRSNQWIKMRVVHLVYANSARNPLQMTCNCPTKLYGSRGWSRPLRAWNHKSRWKLAFNKILPTKSSLDSWLLSGKAMC